MKIADHDHEPGGSFFDRASGVYRRPFSPEQAERDKGYDPKR
jgi:hypothetical protein